MDFKTWCEENRMQELLQCYLNGNNPIPPDKIGYSSGKKVNWKCGVCGLEWQNNLNHMNRRSPERTVCPYCSHERASHFYNAALLYPELEHYWDEQNNTGNLADYTPSAHYNAHWRCKQNHTWQRSIREQVKSVKAYRSGADGKRKGICPYCSQKRVSSGYNLEEVCPEIAQQWNYNKNGTVTPRDVMPYSQRKVWWVCQFNPKHVWEDRIANRTVLLRGCPICSRQFHISFPARAVYFYLRKHQVDCLCEQPVGRYTIDIAINIHGSMPIALEIDGYYTHSKTDSRARDARKDAYLQKNGYRVIRVREDPAQTEGIRFINDVITYPYADRNRYLNQMIKYLLEVVAGVYAEPDHEKDHWQIERLYYHDRKNRSLAVKYPELALEWSEKNSETPDVVLPGSREKRWWQCPKCKKEYLAMVANRTRHHSACPYCAHIRVTKQTSLAAVHPEIAEQWHYEKNAPLTPEDVLPGTDKKVWWRCKEGHEWEAYIYVRTGGKGTGCPVCQGRTVTPEKSLAVLCPELASFWHPTKNTLLPEEVSCYSNRLIWWQCPQGHEWQAMPNNMQKYPADKLCPYCTNRRVWKGYCLESHNPDLAKLWHPEKNACTPRKIAPYSGSRVWWQCHQGHEWEGTVSEMQAFAPDKYCPYCNDRRVWAGNCLRSAAPELARQWHPSRNGTLSPDDVFPWSGRKVWWQCANRHEWQTTVVKRYQRNDGCPYCSGRRASPENCLAVKHPETAALWNSLRNADLTPETVTPKSGKKVWWICEEGHEWQRTVIGQVKSKGCPVCTRALIRHGSLAQEHPELLAQWDYTRNTLIPEQCRAHSNEKVWWICEKKHRWRASPDSRSRGSGCPVCARQRQKNQSFFY